MAVGVLAGMLFCVSLTFATEAWVPDPPNRNVPRELIIGFSPKATSTQIDSAVSSVGGSIVAKHATQKGGTARIRLQSADPSAVKEAIDYLKSNPAFRNVIRYVEPNVIRKAFGAPLPSGNAPISSLQSGDQLLQFQWGYYDIDANWVNMLPATAGVTVAVVDTGVDYNHPDLAGNVIKGYDFVNGDNNPMDDMGHGTHVAGIISAKANNGYGIAGVSWGAKILAIKVLDSAGLGNSYDVTSGIYAAANNSSVKIINLSLGGQESTTEDDAVAYAVNKGKLIVAAAGNDNTSDTTNAYPAALSTTYPGEVLAVAAHDQNHCQAGVSSGHPFSNYGDWVSISAPGYQILSTVPVSVPTPWSMDGFYYLDGTSMAAPHVSGAAALAWAQNPKFTNVQIGNLITTNNAFSLGPLVRDGACWPSSSGTFERLDLLNVLEPQYFANCLGTSAIYGYAFDAESGLPLAGAKVTAKRGNTVTGIDFVPYYGELTGWGGGSPFPPFSGLVGQGLFNVLTLPGQNTLTIQMPNYITFSPTDQNGLPVPITGLACNFNYAGNFPVPPAKPLYWLAVTWDYEYTLTFYHLFTLVYQNGAYKGEFSYDDIGTSSLSSFPYVKLLWDSSNPEFSINNLFDPRLYSEVVRVAKSIPGGKYLFYVEDYIANPDGSISPNTGSTHWASSGIMAYLFKGNTLVKTYTPPDDPGAYWVISDITGTTITDINVVTDTLF